MGEGALEAIRGGSAADEMTVTSALEEEIRRLDPRAIVRVSGDAGGEEVEVRRDTGENVTVSLHNLWIQLRGVSGETAAEAIERFARNCVADFFGEGEGTGNIMPVVRDRQYVDSLRERGFDPVCRELSACGTLFVCLVIDAPEHVRYLGRAELDGYGFHDMDGAEEAAIDAFDAHVRASGSVGVESQPILGGNLRKAGIPRDGDLTVHRLALDGDYDSSLPLLAGLTRHLCADPASPLGHLGGPEDMALALPSRGALLIMDARERHAAEALSLVARTVHDGAAYAVSPHVYRYAPGGGRVMLESVALR